MVDKGIAMILSFIRGIPALWFSLPNGFRWAVYGVMAVTLFAGLYLWWLDGHDQDVIERHEAETVAKVQEQSVEASQAAAEAQKETSDRVRIENEAARKAAEGSDDPLGAMLERLRKGKD